MKDYIVAFDQATKTGWAVLDRVTRKVTESGVESFEKRRGESNGLMFMRFRKWLHMFLSETLGSENVFLVAYEVAHHRGGPATEICVGLQTRIQEITAELGIESAPVRTTVLKKFATGKGNAGKDAMIEAASQWVGIKITSDDEADAICMAMWAESEFNC